MSALKRMREKDFVRLLHGMLALVMHNGFPKVRHAAMGCADGDGRRANINKPAWMKAHARDGVDSSGCGSVAGGGDDDECP